MKQVTGGDSGSRGWPKCLWKWVVSQSTVSSRGQGLSGDRGDVLTLPCTCPGCRQLGEWVQGGGSRFSCWRRGLWMIRRRRLAWSMSLWIQRQTLCERIISLTHTGVTYRTCPDEYMYSVCTYAVPLSWGLRGNQVPATRATGSIWTWASGKGPGLLGKITILRLHRK